MLRKQAGHQAGKKYSREGFHVSLFLNEVEMVDGVYTFPFILLIFAKYRNSGECQALQLFLYLPAQNRLGTHLILGNGSIFIKCGAGNVALIATPGSAPQGVLRGGVGSQNRRRPLKSRWAEQSET